ncbi:uncharacterized protein MYCFIDRAFT_186789 [Pseudocercospora fijiensis CIRAD86]|uniref:NADP-dependent oxidoreductase domain-containing protein n=1 Tax=Pseudocercospora fijiensis (strain CIRAD86) TaxID=383855 RepID=M3APY1_PSEFD|nr:uncharacterized protein MYCFIDRAFT_186789 [Pseudocercospora fijiensis CIRAD86]EME86666.1 hypothetical protein MYCFIDRAFT_186789 [Pseudocercospora fijiensis CIRAD86]
MTAPAAQPPKSLLGRHRILAPTAGVHVSPICLGGIRGRRDEMVLATKYTNAYKSYLGTQVQQSNYGGNSRKSLHVSVEQSLKKLQTSYIDLLCVHYFDFSTQIPEMMHSLHHLVAQGKVLYLSISDTPAWVVVKANCYAREHSLTPFSVYQGRWSAAERDFEREIIPMARDEGMALMPWGSLGGAPYVFPILGGRKVSHLNSNIEALGLRLTPKDIEEIESAYDFQIGFPHNFMTVTSTDCAAPRVIRRCEC